METLTEIQSATNTWEAFVRIRRNGQVFFSRAAVERIHLAVGDPVWFLSDTSATQEGETRFFLRTYGQATGKTRLRRVPGGQSLVCNHLTFSRQLFAVLEKHNPTVREYNTYKCLLATAADENGLYSIMIDKSI